MRFVSVKSLLAVALLWGLGTPVISRASAEPSNINNVDMDSAQRLFQQGDSAGALDTYDSLIKQDPTNFMALYKRGLVHLAQRKDWKAIEDFVKVLELEPSMDLAKAQLKRLYLKFGIYDQLDPNEMTEFSSMNYEVVVISVADLQALSDQAQTALESGHYEECITMATQVLSVSPSHRIVRKARAGCQTHAGYLAGALNDLLWVETLHGIPPRLGGEPFNADTYVSIASIYYYFQDDYEKAMNQLRRCLQFDPDNKACKALHKDIRRDNKERKKTAASADDWSFIIEHFVKDKAYDDAKRNAMRHFKQSPPDMVRKGPYLQKLGGKICEAIYNLHETNMGDHHNEPSGCDDVVGFDSDDAADQTVGSPSFYKLLVDLQKLIMQNRPAEAVKLGENYHTWDERVNKLYSEAHVLYSKAQQEQFHQRQRHQGGGHTFHFNFGGGGFGGGGFGGNGGESNDLRAFNQDLDFYKVLEVDHSASEKEIKSAYRRLSKIYHPDKYRGDLDPVSKMADINEAYQVLSDESLRSQYDNQRGGGMHGNARRQRSHGRGQPQFFRKRQ